MSGTRGGLGRIVAMGIGLAVALLLLVAGEARAGKYAVAQCGWYVGADADWADTTGGAKFRPDAYCVPPAGADPFDGAHLKSFTRDGQGTVSGTRFARWRWVAPAGTGITQVRGTWWHTLHDGIEQRIGVDNWAGGFDAFARRLDDRRHPARLRRRLRRADAGDRGPAALRSRRKQVVLARPRLVVGAAGADDHGRGRQPAGGGHRRRHSPPAAGGAGARTSASGAATPAPASASAKRRVDGARVDLTEYPCAKAADRRRVAGDADAALRARRRPASATIDTTRFSDGRHSIHHCVTDFAGNAGCTADQTVADRQQPAGPSAQSDAGRGRRLAPRRRLRPLLGESRPGAGEPDRRRLLADHRPRRLRHRRPVRRRPGHRRAGRSLGAGARAVLPPPLAARRSRQRRAGLGARRAAALRRRAARSRLRGRQRCRDPRADPGRRHRRALRARLGSDLLPAPRRRRLDRAADQAAAGRRQGEPARPHPRPRRRAPTSSAPMPRTGRATRPRPRCAPTAPRWRFARRHRRWRRRGSCRRRPRRGSSPGCAAATGAATS